MSGVDERVETLEDAILDLADLAAGWCSPKARGNDEVISAAVEKCRASASVLAAAVADAEKRADEWEQKYYVACEQTTRFHALAKERVKVAEQRADSLGEV